MSRTMPYECEHGRILDWGDFAGEDSKPEDCEVCDARRADEIRAAVASLDGAFQLEPDEPLDWYVDGQLDRTIMPGRYLVVPLPDTEPGDAEGEG